jgi:hypothetical protein
MWPDIVEKSKRVLVISEKVARGKSLDEIKKKLLTERYNCPLVLGHMNRGDTFLIRSAMLSKFSISIITTEDASHIMINSEYCETHTLSTNNIFTSFEDDFFCTASFAANTVFFNKEHLINKTYLEYVAEHRQSEVNVLFSKFFNKIYEMIRMIVIQNNAETYSRGSYIRLTTANLYLDPINKLCGCNLSLTVKDFPEWLRSTVG